MKTITIVIALLLVCTISTRDVYRKIAEKWIEADEKLFAEQLQKIKKEKKSAIKTKTENNTPKFVDENGLPLDHFYVNEHNPNIHGQHEGDYLGDGDIMYQPGQREKIYGEKGKRGNKQNDAIRNMRAKWTSGVVPYVIDSSITGRAIDSINAAIKDMNSKTCIKLREKKGNDIHYVNFKHGDGCWSYVGRLGGKQDISIGNGCAFKSKVLHEIMHALGFFHEVARPDRDQYIKIHFGNIKPGYMNAFRKQSPNAVTYFGYKYDYESVMHYGRFDFTANNKATITAKKGDPNRKLGQDICDGGMSETDIAQIRAMYSCPGMPPKEEPTCNFVQGDGTGGYEIFIGDTESVGECLSQCSEKKKEFKDINGITMGARVFNRKRCYCERNMEKSNKSTYWKSCFLKPKSSCKETK